MTESRFQSVWEGLLDECEMELIPVQRVRALALTATQDDLRFLLDEAGRIGREWEAIRDTDAGDVSDDYWRKSRCVAEAFLAVPHRSARLLTAELLDRNSPRRLTAARLLESMPGDIDREALRAAHATEPDQTIRDALAGLLARPLPAPRPWWQIWRRRQTP